LELLPGAWRVPKNATLDAGDLFTGAVALRPIAVDLSVRLAGSAYSSGHLLALHQRTTDVAAEQINVGGYGKF